MVKTKMGKLNYILEELLFESRRKDVIEKYRDRLTDTLNDNPTPINGMMEDDFDKVVEHIESELPHPKYLEFVLNSLCCGGYGADPELVLPLIQNFHRLAERNLIKNKDIYSKEYATPEGSSYVDLSNVYSAVEKGTEKEIRKEEDKKLKGQRDIIYDGPRWRVVVPKSHKASCAYGSGTKWCTTSRGDDSFFKQYTTDGLLFYLIDKTAATDEDNVMYKAALNWYYGWDSKKDRFFAKRLEDATLYDSTDNTVRIHHVLPLLPEEVEQSIVLYYVNSINKLNEKIEKEEGDIENIIAELQEKFISEGVITDLMNKIRRDLPNEQVARLNGGVSELSVDPETKTFWVSFNDYTGHLPEEDYNILEPVYSGFIFGNQEMTGDEQILDLQLHDDDGNLVRDKETLFNPNDLYDLYGRSVFRNFRGTYDGPEYKKALKNFINTRRDQFFNINKKDIVNKLYKQIVNFIVVNSWLRKWDKGENGWYEASGNGKTFWVPSNSSSTFTFKYPPRPNTLISKFIEYIKKHPGTTVKEFYKEVYDFDYYPGYNTQFWGSIKDSGIVKTEKGPRGVLKYYIGPNYKKWTEGNLERYREQSRPWRWNR